MSRTLPPPALLRAGPELPARIVRFAVVGLLSTVAYSVLYLALREFAAPQAANLLALLLTTIGNTALNRRLTFGLRGSAGHGRHQLRGLVTFAICWSLTSASLWLLHAAATPPPAAEIAVLTAANVVATIVRFLLFQGWVFADAGEDGQ
jgi:putative flippase GtrA